jgi:3-hydroxyisobutyrate dehydrogenase-like beta-hydroxyacid dehydrogenase
LDQSTWRIYGQGMEPDPDVAILGLGAMGRRVATRLLVGGHRIAAWNRSVAELSGAAIHSEPAQAVAGACAVLVCVRDDEASEAVWSAAAPALEPHVPLIDLSTITPKQSRRLASRSGQRFLAAPMIGSRPQIEAGRLTLLVGGPVATLERARPLLDAVAGSVIHVGDAGDAACLKLAANGLLAAQLAAAGEVLEMLRQSGVDVPAAATVLGALPVASPVLAAALPRLGGALPSNFPLDLVDKDLGYVLAQTARAPVLEATRARARARDPHADVLSLATPKEHR